MNTAFPSPLLFAELGTPLFGNQWLALVVVLAGIAGFMAMIAALGRWLAATHPDTAIVAAKSGVPSPQTAAPVGPTPEVLAVIAASISAHLGDSARITAVRTAAPPNVEMLMQQWSLEGRRQIYSSHQIR